MCLCIPIYSISNIIDCFFVNGDQLIEVMFNWHSWLWGDYHYFILRCINEVLFSQLSKTKTGFQIQLSLGNTNKTALVNILNHNGRATFIIHEILFTYFLSVDTMFRLMHSYSSSGNIQYIIIHIHLYSIPDKNRNHVNINPYKLINTECHLWKLIDSICALIITQQMETVRISFFLKNNSDIVHNTYFNMKRFLFYSFMHV